MSGQQSESLRYAWLEGKYSNRKYTPRWDTWTSTMDTFLKQHCSKMDVRELCVVLEEEFGIPRTPRAVETRLLLLDLVAANRSLTAKQIAYYLGINRVQAANLIRDGIIAGKQLRNVPYSTWNVTFDAFYQFIRNHPELYNVDTMPNSRWKNEAEVVSRLDPIYTVSMVAQMLRMASQTLRDYIRTGTIQAIPRIGRKGKVIRWYIRRSQLDRYLTVNSISVVRSSA